MNFASADPARAMMFFYMGAGFLGLAAGVFLARTGWALPEGHVLVGRPALKLGLVLAAAAGIGFLVHHLGMRQFGGFDQSVVADIGWRMASGQRPYADFVCTTPPGFYLGAAYAHKLFGASWEALILFFAGYAVLTFLWSYFLLRRIFENYLHALLLAVFVQAASSVLVSFWWYNPITSAAAAVYFLSAVVLLRHPDQRSSWVSYFFALVLAASMKPNVCGVLILGVSAVLFSVRALRWKIAGVSALALAGFVVWLAANHVSLPDVLASYQSIGERGLSRRHLDLHPELEPTPNDRLTARNRRAEKLFGMAALALSVAPLLFIAGWRPAESRRLRLLALVAIAAGCEGLFTNGEAKLTDLSLVLLGCAVYVSPNPLPWGRYVTVLATFLLFMGVAQGMTRYRILAIGYGDFFEYQLEEGTVQNAYFNNLHAGRRFHVALAEIGEVLKRHPGARVFFGPRMQWGYAAFRLPEPRSLPAWWHPGVSFGKKDEAALEDRWAASRFDILVFLGGDRTYFSPRYLDMIEDNYIPAEEYSTLEVLRPKGS